MKLRPYQSAAITRAREAYRAGKRAILIVAPTGAGKTIIALEFVRRLIASGHTILVLCHRKELIQQMVDELREAGIVAGIIAPWAPATTHGVQVASIQTLLARGEAPHADAIITDEAHHIVAAEWGKAAEPYRGKLHIGLTATPVRADGTALGNVYESLVAVAQPRELIQGGHLVPAHVYAPAKPVEGGLARDPVEAWNEYARGQKTVVFCQTVEHARDTAAAFGGAWIDGSMPDDDRSRILGQFKAGAIKVLCNVFLLTEGWNDPSTECCILARGFTSSASYIQAVGRVMRPAPGKTHATIIDLRGVCHVHGMPDADRVYSLEGKGISQAPGDAPLRRCDQCGAVFELGSVCPRCGTEYEPPPRLAPAILSERMALVTASHTPADKAKRLTEWLRVARVRGYKHGWAAYKFRSLYGHFPDHRTWDDARKQAAA